MYIRLDRSLTRPLWLQIVDAVVDNMTHGVLKPGDQLMPSRILAQELAISRSTVQLAYDELTARGYVLTSRRGGTRIIAFEQPSTPPTVCIEAEIPLPIIREFELADGQMSTWLKMNNLRSLDIDFRHQEPYVDELFMRMWRRASARIMKNVKTSIWGYSDPSGIPEIRTEIQQYLATTRGIRIDDNQIFLTTGTQQAIDLIAQGLLQKGDQVAVEDPGFPGARLALTYRGMYVHGIPVDEQGLIVEAIPPNVRLISVTPSHQRPTGVVMSVKRRQQLIEYASLNQCWIIEDDFDGEYRYRGGPLPALFSDHSSNVVYILTFSKVLAPGIRLAAVVGSPQVIERLSKIQSLTQRQPPIMEQLTLAEFFRLGDFTRHIRRMRIVYRNRHRSLMQALYSSKLSRMFRIQGTDTGLHVMLEADKRFCEREAVEAAAKEGVGIYSMEPYCYRSDRKAILLGFAHNDAKQIDEGIQRLERITLL